LTAEGSQRLWSGEIAVLDLAGEDISSDSSGTVRLLLDTLFIAREFRGIHRHRKYPWALLLKNISQFINTETLQIEAFVLPDVQSTTKVMRQVGFEGPHSTGKEKGLYRINLVKELCFIPEKAVLNVSFQPVRPMTKLLAILLEAEVVWRIFEHIEMCRQW
jgi:hypothetical protein